MANHIPAKPTIKLAADYVPKNRADAIAYAAFCQENFEPEDREQIRHRLITRRRRRKPSVVRTMRQLQRAGFGIAGVELDPHSGAIRILTGEPGAAVASPFGNDNDIPDRSDWN